MPQAREAQGAGCLYGVFGDGREAVIEPLDGGFVMNPSCNLEASSPQLHRLRLGPQRQGSCARLLEIRQRPLRSIAAVEVEGHPFEEVRSIALFGSLEGLPNYSIHAPGATGRQRRQYGLMQQRITE